MTLKLIKKRDLEVIDSIKVAANKRLMDFQKLASEFVAKLAHKAGIVDVLKDFIFEMKRVCVFIAFYFGSFHFLDICFYCRP